MKSYTDIEQSKVLAKILPIESADMCWTPFDEEWDAYLGAPNPDAIKKEIPCWSLVALLDVLPKIIRHETLFIETSAVLWHIGYISIIIARADNLIDACVEMILELHNLNII